MPAPRLADRPRIGREAIGTISAVRLVVVRHILGAALFPSPAVATVANDGEQPGALVSTPKTRVVPPRAQIRLLHDVLRLVLVAHDVPGKCVGSVHQGNELLLEAVEKAVSHDV